MALHMCRCTFAWLMPTNIVDISMRMYLMLHMSITNAKASNLVEAEVDHIEQAKVELMEWTKDEHDSVALNSTCTT